VSEPHPLVAALAEERQGRGFPASWAGERAGLGKSTVAQWERGERSPRLDQLTAYAKALGFELTLTPLELP
jgi:transcriptional regulator with XRE-family HTH domain